VTLNERSAGILLHPTSLPGPYGTGELGPEALRFVRFLQDAGQRLWQTLPLSPTGENGSPYSAYSAFAGNPLLVSTDRLIEDSLLEVSTSGNLDTPVNYPAVTAVKEERLREAFGRARSDRSFERFREEHRSWLQDYALYAALKDRFDGEPWNEWDGDVSRRKPGALARVRRELAEEVRFCEWVQYRFFRDWGEVKGAANRDGIEVIGDLPIFVAHDSADVWANQNLFFLDGSGEPTVVAGVPPDYFSETGQLWGNPLYRWERMAGDGYSWWVERMRMSLTLFDAVRIDHFRGLEAYWEVPAGEKTAANGHWMDGPKDDLFEALRSALGELPIIAEDLGDITPEVEALRDRLGLPGMKVLQFAWGSGPDNPYLPHNYGHDNWVVYTGTHDNDTAAGWLASASLQEMTSLRRYVGREYVSVGDLIRLAYSSVAARAVVPMQDVLSLGSEARTNTPGVAQGNWTWRMDKAAFTPDLATRLRVMAETYGRYDAVLEV